MFYKNQILSLACAIVFLAPAAITDDLSVEAKITLAESGGPASISSKAMIMDTDGTMLREGSNGWTCMPGVSLIPGDNHPMCNDATWVRFFKAAASGEPFSTEIMGYSYMLMGDALINNDNPAATDPNDGGNWVQEGPHLMLLFPTVDDLKGISRDPYNGGPYVMWDNTPMAHVMVPLGNKH